MDIPKSFQLHGQRINIVFDESLSVKQGDRGTNYIEYNQIVLQPNIKGNPYPQSYVEQTFLHELVHSILYHMNSDKNNNEEFVNLFANLLHQALTTMEYTSKSKKK